MTDALRIGILGDNGAGTVGDLDRGRGAELPLGGGGVQPTEVNARVDGAGNGAGGIDDGIADPDHLVSRQLSDAVRAHRKSAGRNDAIEKVHDRHWSAEKGGDATAAALNDAVAVDTGNVVVFEIAAGG